VAEGDGLLIRRRPYRRVPTCPIICFFQWLKTIGVLAHTPGLGPFVALQGRVRSRQRGRHALSVRWLAWRAPWLTTATCSVTEIVP
jgi:hypothetical protein